MKVELLPGQATGSTFWLVVHHGPDRLEPLTIDDKGQLVLPVFSFKEEAQMFLELEGFGDDWLIRESSCGELVSVLFGPCACFPQVSLLAEDVHHDRDCSDQEKDHNQEKRDARL